MDVVQPLSTRYFIVEFVVKPLKKAVPLWNVREGSIVDGKAKNRVLMTSTSEMRAIGVRGEGGVGRYSQMFVRERSIGKSQMNDRQ